MKGILLVRALVSRPDLGARVREVILSDLDEDMHKDHKVAEEWLITQEDATILNGALEKFDVHSPTNELGQEVEEGVPLRIKAVTKGGSDRYPWCSEQSALAGLAILLSPNVDNVAIHAHSWSLPCFAAPIGTFDNLTEITWEPGPQGESTVINSSIEWVMEAAPNLKRFYGYIVSDMDTCGKHRGVKKVVMGYSSLDSTSFSSIVRMFPDMTDFTYTADSPPMWSSNTEATPAEIIDELLPLKDTLESLTFDWNFSPGAENDEWDEDEVSMVNLSQMTALTYLSITCGGVIKDESDDESESESDEEDEDEDEDGQESEPVSAKPDKGSRYVKFLRSIMAPNLEVLHLSSVPSDFNILGFADVAAASYPKLKTINLGYHMSDHSEDAAMIKAYFKERGIRIS